MTIPATRPAPTERKHPVIELFGPTIQGEGPDAGTPCVFVRFGGCDYRCSWCDSLHAVTPEVVRRTATFLTTDEIAQRLLGLADDPSGLLAVLSGGNPALHEIGDLVRQLQTAGMRVSVETQGSVWRDWLGGVDRLVVSPKPPSSGMSEHALGDETTAFMEHVARTRQGTDTCLKVVCFDEADYEFALAFRASHRDRAGDPWPLFLSAGTDVDTEFQLDGVARRFRWLCERVAPDPRSRDCVVLPQLHVVAWGTEKGR
ncbi:7-carboxy-7-deazaguanine synthase QueE [Kribbella sp. NPDC058245]|uniref:7-carboxy-7-deazaguanine synthase QueE n=1 Tax=Kribbella sp. NPDC058245 TaxID=3346399 RepID=UPI0036E236E4